MIGLLDVGADERDLLVRIAEGWLLCGGLDEWPYWAEVDYLLSPSEYRSYLRLLEHGLLEPSLGMMPQQVMPTRAAVPLIRWLQGLDGGGWMP